MNHKLVCWNDYAIPVPIEAKWIAMYGDGEWYWYEQEPKLKECTWTFLGGDFGGLVREVYDLTPPEPGDWDTQLYWIGY